VFYVLTREVRAGMGDAGSAGDYNWPALKSITKSRGVG
jgi:hypothetical protein